MSVVLDVCAAVVIRNGRILLATRRPGGHLVGHWEFPGGKQHENETLADCITRELREELDLQVTQASPLFSIIHRYPEKTIRLWFMRCELAGTDGTLRCLEGQEAGWFAAAELKELSFAPADLAALAWLKGMHRSTPEPYIADVGGTEELRQWLLQPAASHRQELSP
ncbi:MAG: (deoxy)nucleoside triphosphate pyrophosphohydrolase [Lentisphaerae bacterium]|jgi:8-oxo-dGTP diphosphatase|nr:(deoxy)nucleoside triphosphate pyrophosphohydrolase [Lentisphaerota bacterium]